MQVESQYAAFPHLLVEVEDEVGHHEVVLVAQKAGIEPLFYFQVYTLVGIGYDIAAVVHNRSTCSGGQYPGALAVDNLFQCTGVGLIFLGKVGPSDKVEAGHRSYEQVIGEAEKEIHLYLRLQPEVAPIAGIVASGLISYTPVVAGHGIEIYRVEKSVPVFGQYMCAAYAEHVKTRSGDIAEERDVRRLYAQVAAVTAVQSGGHDSDAELGGARILWTSDETDIKFFLRFWLVGVSEIVSDFFEKGYFLACGGIGRGRLGGIGKYDTVGGGVVDAVAGHRL